jgi:hypothetical protein
MIAPLSILSGPTSLALQLTYPGTKLSTLPELFDFVGCVDPEHKILFNIESKIDAPFPNLTRTVDDFVNLQHAAFANSSYYHSITVSHSFMNTDARIDISQSVPEFRLENDCCYEGWLNDIVNWYSYAD